MGRTITIDESKLAAMVNAKVEALLAEKLAAARGGEVDALDMGQRSPEAWQAGVAEMKGQDRPAIPYRLVACRSEETGATFLARVVPSRKHPDGRIIALDKYEYPEGVDRHQSQRENGKPGLCPNGMHIRKQDGSFDITYKQWRWENFYKADLAYYVGRPLLGRFRVDPSAEMEPWIRDQPMRADEDEAA